MTHSVPAIVLRIYVDGMYIVLLPPSIEKVEKMSDLLLVENQS